MQFKTLAFAALAATVSAQESAGLVETLSNVTELSNLTSYLGLFPELVSQLSELTNVTLLAPSDEAFETFLNSSAGAALAENDTALIQSILTYHVLNGTYESFEEEEFIPTALQPPTYTNVTGGQVVHVVPGEDGAATVYSGLITPSNITGEPVNFTGGVVHIIDAVLIIPQNVSSTAVEANLTAAVGALTRTELADAVDGLEDVTIFVPTNEAFDNIGNLLGNLTTENLTDILTYHVVNGTVGYSSELENTTLTTLNGENVTISVIDGEVFVNSARVLVPDVLVANGVVHVINGVLNPNNSTAEPDPESEEEDSEPAFEGASSTANDLTSGVPTPTGTTNPTAEAPAATSTEEEGAAPTMSAAVGAAALFGGVAMIANW